MSVLLDTNILTRSAQPGHPHCAAAVGAVEALKQQGDEPCLVPQVLYEYWVVATRPEERNGLGMTTTVAEGELARLQRLFTVRPDVPTIFAEWERLVIAHEVKGKPAHDARLVAAMKRHGIAGVLTFNSADFARFPGITVLHPPDLHQPTPGAMGPHQT